MLRVPLHDTHEDDQDRVTYNGERFTGVTVETFPDGRLLAESSFTDGVQDGPERQFRADGSLWVENIYEFGWTVREREWHPNGRLARDKLLRGGQVVSQQWWDENGDPIAQPGQ
ncbi:hypothetical protein [Nonomuraea sp. NPDC050643]|uniref:toxin-antitoxin system YwqK family antitoxin n=1 Tax=Nonomuraea sp. NPDC050643 TaxID=3155660 RepID=UPI0033FC3E11